MVGLDGSVGEYWQIFKEELTPVLHTLILNTEGKWALPHSMRPLLFYCQDQRYHKKKYQKNNRPIDF